MQKPAKRPFWWSHWNYLICFCVIHSLIIAMVQPLCVAPLRTPDVVNASLLSPPTISTIPQAQRAIAEQVNEPPNLVSLQSQSDAILNTLRSGLEGAYFSLEHSFFRKVGDTGWYKGVLTWLRSGGLGRYMGDLVARMTDNGRPQMGVGLLYDNIVQQELKNGVVTSKQLGDDEASQAMTRHLVKHKLLLKIDEGLFQVQPAQDGIGNDVRIDFLRENTQFTHGDELHRINERWGYFDDLLQQAKQASVPVMTRERIDRKQLVNDGLLIPVLDEYGNHIVVDVQISKNRQPEQVKLWFALRDTETGQAPTLLLDLERVCSELYVGEPTSMERLEQSILLGKGGIVAMERLGITPEALHINEGASALAAVYARRSEQLRAVSVSGVIHTPEQPGLPTFDQNGEYQAIWDQYFWDFPDSWKSIFVRSSGDKYAHGTRGVIDMTQILFEMSGRVAAVGQEFTGVLKRNIIEPLYGERARLYEAKLNHISNGVDPIPLTPPTLTDGHLQETMNQTGKSLGELVTETRKDIKQRLWKDKLRRQLVWYALSDRWGTIEWQLRSHILESTGEYPSDLLKKQVDALVQEIIVNISQKLQSEPRTSPELILKAVLEDYAIDTDEIATWKKSIRLLGVLETRLDKLLERPWLCYGRRWTEYKMDHPALKATGMRRLLATRDDGGAELAIIVAGHSHPNDLTGGAWIRDAITLSTSEDFFGRYIFVPGYDLELDRQMLLAADLWLYSPERKREADGTSNKAGRNIPIAEATGWSLEFLVPEGNFFRNIFLPDTAAAILANKNILIPSPDSPDHLIFNPFIDSSGLEQTLSSVGIYGKVQNTILTLFRLQNEGILHEDEHNFHQLYFDPTYVDEQSLKATLDTMSLRGGMRDFVMNVFSMTRGNGNGFYFTYQGEDFGWWKQASNIGSIPYDANWYNSLWIGAKEASDMFYTDRDAFHRYAGNAWKLTPFVDKANAGARYSAMMNASALSLGTQSSPYDDRVEHVPGARVDAHAQRRSFEVNLNVENMRDVSPHLMMRKPWFQTLKDSLSSFQQVSVHAPVTGSVAETMNLLKETIDFTDELNARTVVIHLEDPRDDVFVDSIVSLIQYAAKKGVRIALEPKFHKTNEGVHWHTVDDVNYMNSNIKQRLTGANKVELVEWFGFVFDIAHAKVAHPRAIANSLRDLDKDVTFLAMNINGNVGNFAAGEETHIPMIDDAEIMEQLEDVLSVLILEHGFDGPIISEYYGPNLAQEEKIISQKVQNMYLDRSHIPVFAPGVDYPSDHWRVVDTSN